MTRAQLTLGDLRIQAAHQEGLAIQGWLSARAQSHVSELAAAEATRINAERERDAARQEVEALKARIVELEADKKRLAEELAKRPPAPVAADAPDGATDCDIIDTHMGRQCRTCGGNDYGGSLCTTDGQRGHP